MQMVQVCNSLVRTLQLAPPDPSQLAIVMDLNWKLFLMSAHATN